jgi:hypothetical protein
MKKYNEAINICLQVIGEQVIENDLALDGIYEAEIADTIIEATKEELLSEGWSFNTDTDWTMVPDTSGYIAVTPSMLRVDPSDVTNNVIRKDGKLYDKENRTYVFTDAVDCDVVWNLDFDDLPVIVQQYIVLKAARILYQRLVGDVNMLEVLIQDEKEARLRVDIHEDDVNDYNIFDNSSVMRMLNRRTNPIGIRG